MTETTPNQTISGPTTSTVEIPRLLKYPRTLHLEGSCLAPGDSTSDQVHFKDIVGHHLVIEEKIDGANCALRFDANKKLFIQSRGHYLIGGPRERHFEQLKVWAATHQQVLFERLGSRYIMYGEWLAAKHTVFYDDLTHYFFEFDVYDTASNVFLDTPARHRLLAGSPVVSVPVLFSGVLEGNATKTRTQFLSYLRPSLYKSPLWRQRLAEIAIAANQDPDVVAQETDRSDLAEGLYVKDERDGVVIARYKYVRRDFLNTIVDPEGEPSTHWLERPHIANVLNADVDLYSPSLNEAMSSLRPRQVL
jgi:hypothetical protein